MSLHIKYKLNELPPKLTWVISLLTACGGENEGWFEMKTSFYVFAAGLLQMMDGICMKDWANIFKFTIKKLFD